MVHDVLYTLNPHENNTSETRLIDTFNYTIKEFYRNKLGPRFHKHPEKQYKIAIFIQDSCRAMKEPHLHVILSMPEEDISDFYWFVSGKMKQYYPSITHDIRVIKDTDIDRQRVFRYCLREDKPIYINSDLCHKTYLH